MSAEHLSKDAIITLDGDAVLRLQGFSLEVNKEPVDVTSQFSTGGWREMLVNLKDWSLSFDGIVVRQTPDLDYEALFNKLLSDSTTAFELTDTSNGVTSVISGSCFLTSLPKTGALAEIMKFSGSFQGSGAITITAHSAEAQAVIDRMTGLTATEEAAISTFVDAEVADSNWSLYDEFYSFGLAGANALIGWVSKTATAVNAPTFDVEGLHIGTTTEYVDSNFIPSVDGVNYQLNNAQAEIFVKESNPLENARLFGVNDGTTAAELRTNANIFRGKLNDAADISFSVNPALVPNSLYAESRTAVNITTLYENGATNGIKTSSSTSIPSLSMHISGYNNSGTHTLSRLGIYPTFQLGGALPNQAAHYTNLLEYLIDLGTFAQPVLDRFSGLSATEETAITDFVNQEMRDGNWGLYDEFFCFALGATNGLIGFKSKTATAVNAPTFSVNGATFDGATNYINTNFIPSVDGVNFTLDNAMHEAYFHTISPVSGTALLNGASSSGNAMFMGEFLSQLNKTRTSTNGNGGSTFDSYVDWQNDSLISGVRVNSSQHFLYRNGSIVGTGSLTSTSLPTVDIYVGARNSDGTPGYGNASTQTTYMVAAAIGFDQSAHNTNLRAMLTTLGTI